MNTLSKSACLVSSAVNASLRALSSTRSTLVQHRDLQDALVLDARQDIERVVVEPFGGIDDEQHRVQVARPLPGGVDHGAIERTFSWSPGVSVSTSWLAPSMTMPRTGTRVVCTLCETIDTLVPTSALTRVDLPALGLPKMAMKPQRGVWLAGSDMGVFRYAFALEERACCGLFGDAL